MTAHQKTHASAGKMSVQSSSGYGSAHSSSGPRSSHSSAGLRSAHASSGEGSSHVGRGDWTACATAGERCTIDIDRGIGAATARRIRWVPRREAALLQWWRAADGQTHTKLFLPDGLEEGAPVLIQDGEIVPEWF